MVTGQAPPPCSAFTLTTVGEKRAAMYCGWDGKSKFNHLFIVELGGYSVVSVINDYSYYKGTDVPLNNHIHKNRLLIS